jgi:hypothetical protein
VAAQLRAVEPAPEPDDTRAKLREQISRVAAAEQARTRAEQARDKAHVAVLAAMRSLDTAKDALREAEADNQANRVAVLMGEAETGPAMSDLRHAVELAETVLAGAKADQDLLDDEIRRRRETLSFAVSARDQAVSAVLGPASEALLQRLRDHMAAAAAIRGALGVLPIGTLPPYWDANREFPQDISMNVRWRDVAESLAHDADAPIPTEI